jgi:hypothetical protein
MADGAETPNIAALPAIARLGTCESARGPDADRHVKLLIQFAVEESLSVAYSQPGAVKHSSGAESSVKRQGANDGSGSSGTASRSTQISAT